MGGYSLIQLVEKMRASTCSIPNTLPCGTRSGHPQRAASCVTLTHPRRLIRLRLLQDVFPDSVSSHVSHPKACIGHVTQNLHVYRLVFPGVVGRSELSSLISGKQELYLIPPKSPAQNKSGRGNEILKPLRTTQISWKWLPGTLH